MIRKWKNILILNRIVIFIMLCLMTLYAHDAVDRYRIAGQQLLKNTQFAEDGQHWKVRDGQSSIAFAANSVQINSSSKTNFIEISQHLVLDQLGNEILVQGKVAAQSIEKGERDWETGRIVLIQTKDGLEVYSTPHLLVSIDGSHEWQDYAHIFRILPGATDIRLAIQLAHCTGELQVKDLAIHRVEVDPKYTGIRLAIFGVWGAFFLFLLSPGLLLGISKKKHILFVVLVCIFLFIGTMVPGSVKNEARMGILHLAHTVTLHVLDYLGEQFGAFVRYLKIDQWLTLDISKIAHFVLFAFLGGILRIKRRLNAVSLTLLDTLMLASGTELIQLFIEDRSALVGDVIIDMMGVLVAFAVLDIRREYREAKCRRQQAE